MFAMSIARKRAVAAAFRNQVGRSLMTADEVRRISVDGSPRSSRAQRPIRTPLLKYHEQPYFKRLAEIEPPRLSDPHR